MRLENMTNMNPLSRGFEIARKEGVFAFISESVRYAYGTGVRPVLPSTGYRTANSVRLDRKKPLDHYFDRYSDSPVREDGVVSSHKAVTQSGDSIVVVGGGHGVTVVRAANIVGSSGRVTVYEGGKEAVKEIRRVLDMNNVGDRCEVHHAIVGTARDVYGGDSATADTIHPSELPECDVLELDCEGSEIDILLESTIQPRVIIAELHPWEYQETPDDLLEILSEQGYEINHHFGHDGTPLSQKEFETLLWDSNVRGEKYLKFEGRWPVVIAAVRRGV